MQNKHIPIFLASNDKYAPFVATTIASVCYNTKSFCDFYVLDSGISSLNKNRIEKLKEQFKNFSVEYLSVDLSKFDGFKSADYISLDTYSRFYIPLLKPELEKAIYMDVDMIALGDIQELYDIELGEYALGAVPEQFGLNVKTVMKQKINCGEEHKYFNAGLLLMDLKKWRDNNILESLLKIEKEYKEQLTYADQCILNKCFDNNYKQLDNKFNVMIQYMQEHNHIANNIVIRHFEGRAKPWLTNMDWFEQELDNFNEFWFYAKMTDFYDILYLNYFNYLFNKKCRSPIRKIKLFNFIPLFKIIDDDKKIHFKLFRHIPFLTMFKR